MLPRYTFKFVAAISFKLKGDPSVTLKRYLLLHNETQVIALQRFVSRKIEQPHAKIKQFIDQSRNGLPSASCGDLRSPETANMLENREAKQFVLLYWKMDGMKAQKIHHVLKIVSVTSH